MYLYPFFRNFEQLSDLDDHRACVRSGLINNGVYFLSTDRHNVVGNVLDAYSTQSTLHKKEIKVRFTRERGLDGGGLRRELCNCFWLEYGELMDGALDKVPQVIPKTQSSFFNIGRFLSHAYLMTGYFPITLSIASAKVIICGQHAVTDEELCSSFSRFVDPFEARVLEKPSEEELQTVVVPMLGRFNVFTVPTVDNLSTLIKKAAFYALVAKPYFALSEIRRGMFDAHPSLWTRIGTPQIVDELYDALRPTVPRVLAMIDEPTAATPHEDMTFDFLRRLIHSLNPQMLQKFLCFVTGFSVCSPKKITLQFNQLDGFGRRPTANTCSNILHLPTSYESYASFTNEFNSLLSNPNMWFFDAI